MDIRQQNRKSLAMRVTPAGIKVLIPLELEPTSAEVQQFIENGLAKLHPPQPESEWLSREDVLRLVDEWADRLAVEVKRIQVRRMTNKWGSISTAGILTLADDLLQLSPHLVEYVIVHELLHLKNPTHSKVYRLLLSQYVPDWQSCEEQLAGSTIVLMKKPISESSESGTEGLGFLRLTQGN